MWTVPNVITVGRIAFCPVLAGLIVTSQHELALAGERGLSSSCGQARTDVSSVLGPRAVLVAVGGCVVVSWVPSRVGNSPRGRAFCARLVLAKLP